VEQLMMREMRNGQKRFVRQEWLNYRQIASYFSRRKRIQQMTGCVINSAKCPDDDATTEGGPGHRLSGKPVIAEEQKTLNENFVTFS
jgi:hypothetical protein